MLERRAVVAKKSPLDIRIEEGNKEETGSVGRVCPEEESWRRIKRAKRRESIEREKYEVKDCGEKIMKGRL